MQTNNIITVVKDPGHCLGKQLERAADGTITKHSAVSLSFGIAIQHLVETHEELVELLQDVSNDPHAAIINSSFNKIPVGEEFIILSAGEIEQRLGIPQSDRERQLGIHAIQYNDKTYKAVGRFKENVSPSSWLLLDRDIDQHTPTEYANLSTPEWLARIGAFLPGVEKLTYVETPSASSRVMFEGASVGTGNSHVLIQVGAPEEIERLRSALLALAANAGLIWIKPRHSRTEPDKVVASSWTTILDPSVWTRGRLVFDGKPAVGEGLTVEPLQPVIHRGETDVYDLSAIALPDAAQIREIKRKTGLTIESDGSGVKISSEGLTLATEIETQDHGSLTVSQIIEQGINGKLRCQSPFRDSHSWAAFYSTNADRIPFVYDSGTGVTEWLCQEDKEQLPLLYAMGVIKRLMVQVVNDPAAPFEPEAIAALQVIQKKNPAYFQRLRAELKNANPKISLVGLDRLLKATASDDDDELKTHHAISINILQGLTVGEHRPVGHAGELYYFDEAEGIWSVCSIDKLAQLVAESHDGQTNCKRGSDYRAIAQHMVSLATDDTFFEHAAVGLACPDGFYRIKADQVMKEKLTAEHRQRVKLGFSPVEMPTPLFKQFLHETFQSRNPLDEEEQIGLLQELAGATTTGIAHKYQKAALLFDPFGRAGKGTYERIQRELVPAPYISAVSPFFWDREYFLASLVGMRLNVVGELADDKPIPAAAFKTVTGGDMLTGRHPTHRPVQFKNEAAHFFMSNHLINTTDHSEAFFSRWIIIEFPNSRLASGLPIDPDLAERIIKAEMPGIAYWALMGAARLVHNGAYSKSSAHERLMAKWRRRTNSLEEFLFDACELDPEYLIRRSSLYKAYTSWCSDSGRKPFAKAKVKDLLAHNIGRGITHTNLDGNEIFRGVQLNKAYAEELGGFAPAQLPPRNTKNDPPVVTPSEAPKAAPDADFSDPDRAKRVQQSPRPPSPKPPSKVPVATKAGNPVIPSDPDRAKRAQQSPRPPSPKPPSKASVAINPNNPVPPKARPTLPKVGEWDF